MKFDEFLTIGVHFDNFQKEQLKEIFDKEEIEKIDLNDFTKNSVLLLSQFLVGNVEDPKNEILEMDSARRINCLSLWLDVVQDEMNLRQIGRFILHLE